MKFVKLNMYRNPCIYPLSGLHIEFCGRCAGDECAGDLRPLYDEIIFHQNARDERHCLIVPFPIYIKMVEDIERFLVNEQTVYDVTERREAITSDYLNGRCHENKMPLL